MDYRFSWIDYLVIAVPLIIVLIIGCRSRRYITGVADFLAAGRLGGRYVVAVASGESAMGLITVVAMLDVLYNGGFAIGFWNRIGFPLTMILGLTGFCTYRFRETKALTLGQYLEMRYSRNFRILAAILQAISGIMNYAIFPAIGGRFLMYYLDLPSQIMIGEWALPTIGLLMASFLGVALFIVLLGGQITNMVTDCVQGLISYPLYLVILVYIFYRFSWSQEMAPTLLERASGESFVNPFDISRLKTFNLVYVTYGLFIVVMNRISWSGSQGYAGAAKSAHEQKMAGLLGSWRGIFSTMIITVLAVAIYTYMHHQNFATQADLVHRRLAIKAFKDVAPEMKFTELHNQIEEFALTGNLGAGLTDYIIDSPSPTKNYSPYYLTTYKVISKESPEKAQAFQAIYNQMTVTTALRSLLPVGLAGAFCALMILMLISTDTTYMHSWGSILIQDILMPLRKKPFTVKGQLTALRCAIVFVAIFIFIFSLIFQQNDYIVMFLAITGAIWYGGASTVLVLGLYWKRGTTLAAYITLIFGSAVALFGLFAQQYWVSFIYPLLQRLNLVHILDSILMTISSPLYPYINWRITASEYPINSIEQNFITMLASIGIYVGISFCQRKEFNLNKMLHRGIYSDNPQALTNNNFTYSLKGMFSRLIGIDREYTLGDKILAWSVFIYSFGWMFVISFVGVLVWNYFSPFTNAMWVEYFYITSILTAGIFGIITVIWFSWGGVRDLYRLFRDLKTHANSADDNGSVVHSFDDVQELKD